MSSTSLPAYSTGVAAAPHPSRPARVASIDLLRGLVMILMVLDHTRDFFSHPIITADPSQLPLSFFFTRWVTHLCAPTFAFLAGVSCYLQRARGSSPRTLGSFLVSRGLWLLLLDCTVLPFCFFFRPSIPLFEILGVIGAGFILLAVLQRLPLPVLTVLSLAVIAGHNLLDSLPPASFGALQPLWLLLHQPGPLFLHHHLVAFVIYPFVPWISVVSLGFCFGRVVTLPTPRRIRLSALLGAASLLLFLLLRSLDRYGDPTHWSHAAAGHRLASFLNVTKYPPSLEYLALTLGAALTLLAALDALVATNRASLLHRTVEVYGRVPLVFYLVHLAFIHTLALLTCLALGISPRLFLAPLSLTSILPGPPPGFGFSLPVIYVLWVLIVLVLFLPMRRYARFKRSRPDLKILSYL